MGKKPIASVTYENERISIKKQLTSHKMCVTSLLYGPWADLWPFYDRKPFTWTWTTQERLDFPKVLRRI